MRRGAALAVVLVQTAGCGDATTTTTVATTTVATTTTTVATTTATVATALPPPSSSTSGAPAAPTSGATTTAGCDDLVPARGMRVRETDVARRAPGRGPRPHQLRGFDTSTRAPWKTLRDQDLAFAFVQAAIGSAKNTAFADNWAMGKRCALPRGAYHFITPQSSGAAQAKLFLEQLGGDPGELPPTVDVEKPPSCEGACCGRSCEAWEATVRDWVDTVRAATHRAPMIYAVEPFWNECVCGSKAFAGHRLWMPAWPKFDFPDPVKYGGWSAWAFYQYDGNVRMGDGVIDLNLFHAGRSELAALVAEVGAEGSKAP